MVLRIFTGDFSYQSSGCRRTYRPTIVSGRLGIVKPRPKMRTTSRSAGPSTVFARVDWRFGKRNPSVSDNRHGLTCWVRLGGD
ncbi:hypothetical protein ACLOJK_022253 [Asimina triloba]